MSYDSFKCKGCGKCCQGHGVTPLTKKDIERIEKKGYKNFYVAHIGKYVLWHKKGNSKCIFLNNVNECSIYNYRPQACRNYSNELCLKARFYGEVKQTLEVD